MFQSNRGRHARARRVEPRNRSSAPRHPRPVARATPAVVDPFADPLPVLSFAGALRQTACIRTTGARSTTLALAICFRSCVRATAPEETVETQDFASLLTAPMDRAFALHSSANRLPLEHLPRAAVFAGRAQHYQ